MQSRQKERRVFPRFMTDFSVELGLESEGKYHNLMVRSVNLSRRSMQVQGSPSVMAKFLAQQEYPHKCVVKFKVPGDSKLITIKCQMVTHRRLSREVFYLALGFVEFAGDAEGQLENYLLSLKPCGIDRLIVPTPSVQPQRIRM